MGFVNRQRFVERVYGAALDATRRIQGGEAVKILGHRGASADRPENTLEAFTEALAQGADGVELDVMQCESGELVVCHDETLERLAGLPWHVAHTPYSRLKKVDVGTSLGFSPARIPRLEEVFEALPTSALINVEIKCEQADDGGLAVAVGECIARLGRAEQVWVSSFNALCLLRLSQSAPMLRRGQLIDPDKSYFWQAWGVTPVTTSASIHPHLSACTPARVRQWHRSGWQVAVWTVDSAADALSMRDMGVDMLITNRPAALKKLL